MMAAKAWLSGTTGRRADRTFRVRLLVQGVFAIICLLMGIQFARWVTAAGAGVLPLPKRPAGVEAFLPISGLMGLLDWAYQGSLNVIHPAATVLVLLAIAVALLLRKSFCSWICPGASCQRRSRALVAGYSEGTSGRGAGWTSRSEA